MTGPPPHDLSVVALAHIGATSPGIHELFMDMRANFGL
jgi:hypothetical protein